MLTKVFRLPEKRRVFWDLIMRELFDLGVSSIGLVSMLSLFSGAIVALQMAQNIKDTSVPIPKEYIGSATKIILVLELSPTIISVILAGKVGSYIASSIGSMRVTEQIDALEVIGVNAESYLILPKIIASVFFNPFLVMIGISMGIFGGYIIGLSTGNWTAEEYISGIQSPMENSLYLYVLVKTILFAFVIASVPAFYGFYVDGGSLEVGRSSTSSVVWTCVMIFVLNLVVTQMWLG